MNKTDMSIYSPTELIITRSQALSRGDFGFIYDSYHSGSNFRRQFIERDEYLKFGQDSLAQDYKIISCQILAERVGAHEAQVIYLIEMKFQDDLQRYAELAWLLQENYGWRYHRSQKIPAEELPVHPESLDFDDFAKLDPATVF